MSKINCHGERRRRSLIHNYEITPIRRFHLLPGQTVKGCCRKIVDLVYEFSFKDKTGKFDHVYCGHGAGDNFLHLLGCSTPPVFNWESCQGPAHENTQEKSERELGPPLNREAMNALGLLVCVEGVILQGDDPIARVFREIRQAGKEAIPSSTVKSINTIYMKFNTTTGELLQKIKSRTNTRKVSSFHFFLMNEILLTASNVNKVCIEARNNSN